VLKIISKIPDLKKNKFGPRIRKLYLNSIKENQNLYDGELTKLLIEGLGKYRVKDAIPILREKFENDLLYNYDNWELILELFDISPTKDDYLVRNCSNCQKTLLKCQRTHSKLMSEIAKKSNEKAKNFFEKKEYKQSLHNLNVSYTLASCDLNLMIRCLIQLVILYSIHH
jgi:hypothetical protein